MSDEITAEEKEALHNIKYELGLCVKWGVLTQNMLDALVQSMDMLVFLENENSNPSVVKSNPFEALFPKDQSLIKDSPNSAVLRRYVLLGLLKKLLGSMKTQINKELKNLLFTDLEASGTSEESEMAQNEIVATIYTGENRNCSHSNISIRQISPSKSPSAKEELHTYCKLCRQIVKREILSSTGSGSNKKHKERGFSHYYSEKRTGIQPRVCKHPSVIWKEGEEGNTALCSVCSDTIKNPQDFKWVSAGLEPYGDDPSQNEVLIITKPQKEMAI